MSIPIIPHCFCHDIVLAGPGKGENPLDVQSLHIYNRDSVVRINDTKNHENDG